MRPDQRHGVTRREWRIVLIGAVLIMTLTSIPYLVGFAAQRDGWQFGGFVFGADDGNSYLAKMRQGAEGDWLFHIVYTSERHAGAFLFAPYLMLGKLAALFTPPDSPALFLTLVLVFHLARILFGLLVIAVTYRFIALFVPRGSMRWTALVLICLGGGLGWLLILFGQDNWLGSAPVDFYLPEGYTFYLLYGLPHLSLARAALLGGFILFIKGTTAPVRSGLLAGACWLLMGLCVPFYVAVLYAVLGAWGLAAWLRARRFPGRLFMRCVIAACVPAPSLIYNFWVFSQNPIMGTWSNQNKLASPHPLHYVLGFGVLTVLALPGVVWAWRRGKTQQAYLLLPAWIIAAPLLAYLPVSVQRRLLEGVFVPLCILALIGLRFWIVPRLRTRRLPTRQVWRRAVTAVLCLTLPTTLLLLGLGVLAATRSAAPVFHPPGEIAALDWLNAHAVRDTVILSSALTGNYLPARTNLRAFVGHGPETIGYDQKRALAAQFFAGSGTLAQMQTPNQDPIRYIFYGLRESAGNKDKTLPATLAALKQIYAQDEYTIFEVP